MTDRDHLAAAALTGLLAQGDDGSFSEESYARAAYRWADAMLRCRGGGDCPVPDNPTLTDAEREAVTELTDDPDFYGLTRTHTKVLRGLLKRLGGAT
jgi:hypothetical protein